MNDERAKEDEKKTPWDLVMEAINAQPTYADYVAGKVKCIAFFHNSKTGAASYMWTTEEADGEVDQDYFDEFCSRGYFDSVAIFKLHKIITWEKKEDAEDESEGGI